MSGKLGTGQASGQHSEAGVWAEGRGGAPGRNERLGTPPVGPLLSRPRPQFPHLCRSVSTVFEGQGRVPQVQGQGQATVRDGKAGRGARFPSARCAPRPPAPASCSWAVQCPPPGQGSCDEAARAQGCSAPLEGSPGGRFTEGTQEGSVQRGTTRGKCVPGVDAGWTPRTPHVLAAVSGNRQGHRGPAGTEFPSVGKGGRWGQLHTSLTCPHSLVTSAV